MVVLVTCKNEDLIKNEGARVFTLYINFSDAQGQITPESEVISGRNLISSKLFMHVLVTCKNKDDSIKNEGTRVVTTFFPYKSMEIFPDAQWQLTLQSLV